MSTIPDCTRQITDNLYVGGLCSPKKAEGQEIDKVISLHLDMEQTTHAHQIVDGEHDYEEFRRAVNRLRVGQLV